MEGEWIVRRRLQVGSPEAQGLLCCPAQRYHKLDLVMREAVWNQPLLSPKALEGLRARGLRC